MATPKKKPTKFKYVEPDNYIPDDLWNKYFKDDDEEEEKKDDKKKKESDKKKK